MKQGMMMKLEMKRGKRTVLIGFFPTRWRARIMECSLEWNEGWKPAFSEIRVVEETKKTGGAV